MISLVSFSFISTGICAFMLQLETMKEINKTKLFRYLEQSFIVNLHDTL